MVAIIIIIAIIVFAIGYVISISNGLNRAIIKIDEANSDIDVSLTKRYDVLTKMMDTVKALMSLKDMLNMNKRQYLKQ